MRVSRRCHGQNIPGMNYITFDTRIDHIIQLIRRDYTIRLSYVSCLGCFASPKASMCIFITAASYGSHFVVYAMLRSILIPTHTLNTALVEACTHGHSGVTWRLLENGASVSFENYTPLRVAINNYDHHTAMALLLYAKTDNKCRELKQLLRNKSNQQYDWSSNY